MSNYLSVGKAVTKLFTSGERTVAKTFVTSSPVINLTKNATKITPNSNPVGFIRTTTKLSDKMSTRLYEYLPVEAQENFNTLINAGKKLNFIKTDMQGNITSKSLDRFLKTWDKDSYSKMMFLQNNFKDLSGADFKRIMNAYSSTEKMTANKANIEKWLNSKDEISAYSKLIEKEAQQAVEVAKKDIFELTGFMPECRGKSFESIYDKISRKIFAGKDISSMDTVKKEITDSIGTRINFKDASPEKMRQYVDGICKGIKTKRIKVTEITNYTNNTVPYLSEAQFNQIKKAAAESGYEIPTKTFKIKSKSGFACAQMNIKFLSGLTGESQCRTELMHKYAEFEHLLYDVRMGKNIGKNIPELEKYLEPFEDQIHMLKRNGLNKIHDKYLWDCYQYIRRFEQGKIKSKFKLPKYPKRLREYDLLKFENLEKIHNDMERIKTNVKTVAQVA